MTEKKKERDTAADGGKAQSYFISTSLRRCFNVVREGRLQLEIKTFVDLKGMNSRLSENLPMNSFILQDLSHLNLFVLLEYFSSNVRPSV